jgi:hypothetical protein
MKRVLTTKLFRLLLGLIMTSVLAGCEKHDIMDIQTTYCKVIINGEEYKDAPTLKEFGRHGYPKSTKERIFIYPNQENIAYLQFLLTDRNDKMCYYLFGGIPFPEGETFPLLNKEYSLRYHPEFDMTSIPAGRITKDYIQSSGNQAGIMFVQKHYEMSNELINPLYPLSGTIVFTEYNPKNKKYKGTWHMKNGNENYEITGEFNSRVAYNEY